MSNSHLYTPVASSNTKTPQALKTLTKAILAISLATTGTAYASGYNSDYSSVTFFGDSLTDGGYFKPVLDKEESGQFTTNPDNTWATSFAESLGLNSTANTLGGDNSGNNYAIGGARAGQDVEREGLPVASAKTQLDTYLANNNVDSNGLYSVWIGANDLFAASDYIQKNIGSFISNKEGTIQKAIDGYILPAVEDQIATVSRLHTNGAEYILVPNIPDVGLTPETIQADEAIEGNAFLEEKLGKDVFKKTGNRLAAAYNDALYQKLQQSGANIIPLDTFSLLQQVAADPAAYGYKDVSTKACGDTSSLECGRDNLKEVGAENSYFFADSIHPTGRAHRMIADYANAVTTAPSQVGLLPHIATQSGLATTQRLQNHINQRQDIKPTQPYSGPSVWASVDVNSMDVAGFDSSGNTQVLLGLDYDYAGSADAVTGIYGHISQAELDKSIRSGINKVDHDEIGIGLYHSNKVGNVQLNGAVGYGKIDMDINRVVSLDDLQQQFESEIDGKRYYATLQAGYPIQFGDFAQFSQTSVTPYLAATFNQVKLDAIEEKEMTGIAMQFDKQKYNTTYGTLGLKANTRLSDRTHIFGDVHYQKQLDDNQKQVTARLNTQPDMPFTTPKFDIDDDSFGMSLGISREFGAMTANAGVSHSTGDDDDMTSVFVGLSSKF
ncbi:autotransporter domain-containing protein [Psychrobacter sp. FDAARGOS_221]|uniref:autotransporter domain-containing protein n=1 Tax=Psychrobacter sp. FDAARGOS_221 TaxID=1975705 RepID=UPI000BB56383|nr:autotransporter domain-containing protein [Psychrobacter sp. FDAARGOS_221]PNK60697.1 autotransporter domain-containing protein [Psychrobacter sp. FDAARGOS_221]